MASKKDAAKNYLNELKKNTEVLDMTFEKAGLQIIQQSWQSAVYSDGWLDYYIEVTGEPDKIGDKYVTIKVNLYDTNGDILTMETGVIEIKLFSGYETKHITFHDDGLLYKACKARVFAVRGQHFY